MITIPRRYRRTDGQLALTMTIPRSARLRAVKTELAIISHSIKFISNNKVHRTVTTKDKKTIPDTECMMLNMTGSNSRPLLL